MSSKYIIADNDPEIVYFLNELKAFSFKETDIFYHDEHGKLQFHELSSPFDSKHEISPVSIIKHTLYAEPYALYLEEKLQSKDQETPDKFQFNSKLCESLFFDPIEYPSDSQELEDAHTSLLKAFDDCHPKINAVLMHELDERAEAIASQLIKFADVLQRTTTIPQKLANTFKVSFLTHFVKVFMLDEVIENQHTNVNNPEEEHPSAPIYFYILNKAAFLVLGEIDVIKNATDKRTWVESFNEFMIRADVKPETKDKMPIRSIARTLDNVCFKLLIYILERQWDKVQEILSPEGTPLPCNTTNMVLALEKLMPYGIFSREDESINGRKTRENLIRKLKNTEHVLDTIRKD